MSWVGWLGPIYPSRHSIRYYQKLTVGGENMLRSNNDNFETNKIIHGHLMYQLKTKSNYQAKMSIFLG